MLPGEFATVNPHKQCITKHKAASTVSIADFASLKKKNVVASCLLL
jgi:hypothetical protein